MKSIQLSRAGFLDWHTYQLHNLWQAEKSKAAVSEGKDADETVDSSGQDSGIQSDLFEENFKELKKWVDVKSSKYGTLLVVRERRSGRLGTALKVIFSLSVLGTLTHHSTYYRNKTAIWSKEHLNLKPITLSFSLSLSLMMISGTLMHFLFTWLAVYVINNVHRFVVFTKRNCSATFIGKFFLDLWEIYVSAFVIFWRKERVQTL